MANLAIASPPPADVDHMLTLAREALGVAERVYGRLMLLEKVPAFFAPRAALAIEKLSKINAAYRDDVASHSRRDLEYSPPPEPTDDEFWLLLKR
jgi:hypothetical protein